MVTEECLTMVLELINDWPINRIEVILPLNFHKLVRN